jgi:hypothetical protein
MAIHVYECGAGHKIEIVEPASHDLTGLLCGTQTDGKCRYRLALSAAVSTGAPVLKKGCGGFEKPTRD